MLSVQEQHTEISKEITKLENRIADDIKASELLESKFKSLDVLSKMKNCTLVRILVWTDGIWSESIRIEGKKNVAKLKKLVLKIFGAT